MATETIDEELRLLEYKLAQLKRDYDQYFLGNRPREPVQLRSEVNKAVIELTNTAIKNTGSRFKFSSICSRFQAFRRQWDEIMRKIEAGTYERHRFKAKLHEQQAEGSGDAAQPAEHAAPRPADDLYQTYIDARVKCGEHVKGLSREKLDGIIAKQRTQLTEKFGKDAQFRFRVEIEGGKARLKATRVKAAKR